VNEAETRAEYIDPALKAAGWGVVEGSRILREHHITPGRIESRHQGALQRAKPSIADYVLVYRNHRLAVIEAKPDDSEVTEGLGQAKIYSEMMQVRYAIATNGRGIYSADMHTGAEGLIPRYPTPEELWNLTFGEASAWRDRFAAVPPADKGSQFQTRYYQDIAIERTLQAIADGKQRILLTLATGTGKTFIAFQVCWKLFHARWNLSREPTRLPRILFLTDRNVLANQAFNAFSAFPDDALVRIDPGSIRKRGKVPTNGSLFFTIFQTFMCGPREDEKPSPYFGDYPADFFDFIIVDECHRGGANDESTWRGILEYFSPAVQLGLTATPRRDENIDTYRYFGEPVYIYSLKQGINDGFLTPFRVKQYATTLDEYIYTPDDTVLEGEIEEGRRYREEDFNRVIRIIEREEYRVKLFMEQINQREKTIVFCATQEHARAVRDLINQMKTVTDPNYCHRVTANEGEIGEMHLREFQDNERTTPTVLTTSHKLSTGIDALDIRNIVLMRPIRSLIEFKQIIGRGTRLYEGKAYFTIHDFVKAYERFSDPEWDGEPLQPEPCSKCGEYPCVCDIPPPPPPPPCPVCGKSPCECVREPCAVCGRVRCICGRQRVVVKLADGKARRLQAMMATGFYHPDGRPMSAQQFMEALYGKLPDFFRNEDELREIWADPATRSKLLESLAAEGFGFEQLREMQRLIEAEDSDLFDVLAYVAYALPTVSREQRAELARRHIREEFGAKQRAFLEFVLGHYITVGVQELAPEKLNALLKLRYHSAITDATADLGQPTQIRQLFDGFQKYLYIPEQGQ
jgi:type I restriction enzyme R subunit